MSEASQPPSPIVDDRPDLQQRLVTALYGPGVRRSDTVEELADALIAVAAALTSPPKAGVGEPVAWTTKDGLEYLAAGYGIDVSAEKHGTRNIPLYATPEPRGDGVRVTDEMLRAALEAWDKLAGYGKMERMRAALEAALNPGAMNTEAHHGEPQFGIRICPERDGPCPHGMACPYTNDRWRCDMDASRAAISPRGP